VKKRGAFIIYSFIQGIISFYPPYILMFILSGLIAELLLYKKGYGNLKYIGISYVIQQALASIGSVIYPYTIQLFFQNFLQTVLRQNEELNRNLSDSFPCNHLIPLPMFYHLQAKHIRY